jgi:hypothetical protein
MLNGPRGKATLTFTVPAGAGTYATEVYFLGDNIAHVDPNQRTAGMDFIEWLTANLPALIATATVEVDVLMPGGDPTNAAHWLSAFTSFNAAGWGGIKQLIDNRCRVRCKSGGTAGTQTVHMYWA